MEKQMIKHLFHQRGALRSALSALLSLPFLLAANASAQEPEPDASPVTNTAPVDPAANANPAAGTATTERVIVTGSYIPTAETESALPVTVYTAEVLQKAGAQNPVEGLRQLPSFVGNATTENDSNGGNGSAGINLRGVGQQNTLVLINGRRAFLGVGNNTSADINAISIGALSRTEILKDGASAIYGSDAVAGVVNFNLLNAPGEAPYEGAEIFALYGNTTEADAHVRQVYIRGGVTGLDGKVAIAAAGEYYSRAGLFSRDRTIATSGDLSNNPTGLGLGGINNNSPTYSGRVSVGPGPLVPVSGELTLQDLSQGGTVVPGDYRAFDAPATGGAGTDPDRFNFRAFSPAIPAQEMAKYYVSGRYKIFGEGLQVYGDIMYSKVKQDNALAAAPFAVGGQESPFNPFGDGNQTIFNPNDDPADPDATFTTPANNLNNVRYRTVQELGNRRSFFDNDYYRYVVGINGDFNFQDNSFISHFGYDSGLVYERYDNQRIDSGDAQFTPLDAEITAGNFNPFIGQNAPTSGVAATYTNVATPNPAGPAFPDIITRVPTGATAPYDNSAAAQRAAYLGHSFFFEHDWLADVKVNAHLFPNLWNGGVDVAGGYEHRQLRQHSVPDPVQAAGDQLGFNQAPNTKTKQEVDSYFGEIGVPLVNSTMNIPFVRSLEFQFAYRFESFEDEDSYIKSNRATFDNGGTPRLTIRYQPIADITMRASWGQSFLSPNPTQLFNPVAQGFPVVFDPAQGLTLQPQEGVWQGGSPILTPEETDSYTAGVVWTPKFIPGFTMTVDWYQLYTTNLLLPAASAAQVLLTQGIMDPDGYGNGSGTVDGPGGPANGITRDPVTGTLLAIDADNLNAGTRLVQGLDVTAVYEIPTQNFGTFTISGGWNHFFTWKAQPGVGESHNFLGDFSATFPLAPGSIPFNKAFLRGEWQWKGFDFIATGNYIGDFEDDPNFILGNDLIPGSPGTGTIPPSNNPQFIEHRRVTDYITLDMQLSYEWLKPEMAPAAGYSKDAKDGKNVMSKEVAGVESSTIWQRMLWNTKLTVGVNNAFDRQPPSVLGAFNDNYDTSLYNIRNRYWYVSVGKKF
ncbi:MAG TPA: TonB-dependent receptor [Chthoniobacterales bacterium]|nr:TonB-dependent receptor [Chthoniobacterales bacterium]